MFAAIRKWWRDFLFYRRWRRRMRPPVRGATPFNLITDPADPYFGSFSSWLTPKGVLVDRNGKPITDEEGAMIEDRD